MERLLQIQAAMEELAGALEQAEGVRDAWEPVGDLFIDSLQDHIDATKVPLCRAHSALFPSYLSRTDINWIYLQSNLIVSFEIIASGYA